MCERHGREDAGVQELTVVCGPDTQRWPQAWSRCAVIFDSTCPFFLLLLSLVLPPNGN